MASEHEDAFKWEFDNLESWWNNRGSPIQLWIYGSDIDLRLELVPPASRYNHVLVLSQISADERNLDLSIDPDSDPANGTASTAANPKLWRHWLQACAESHTKCRNLDHKLPPFSPDRLVEISTDDNGNSFSWRVVSKASIGIVQYLTLSHCWGSSKHACLTSSNHSAFSKFAEYYRLPKTFQDAFLVAFQLGSRFIWIDSLCIMQDDLGDWETQASMMGSIYKNAHCNVVSSWAKDGSGGCFTTRNHNIITLDFEQGHSIQYRVSLPTFYYDDITEAPLNYRGWVAQERFLARRQLSFAQSQVHWECHEVVASEDFPTGIPSTFRDFQRYNQAIQPNGKPTFELTTEGDFRKAWAALVDFYSDCQFTRLSDKTIALAGLADEMREATGDTYLAGLWKKDLRRQLCWAADYDVRRKVNRSVISPYLVPTWSWVNLNGPVMCDLKYRLEGGDDVYCLEVLDASITSDHPSKLHSFVSSNLVLRGIAVWARVALKDNPLRQSDDNWKIQLSDSDKPLASSTNATIAVSMMWDENISSSEENPERWSSFLDERRSNFLFMFVAIGDGSYVEGLVLRRLPDATKGVVYARVGIFTNSNGELSDMIFAKLQALSCDSIEEDVNLDDARLEGLVHTVTVV